MLPINVHGANLGGRASPSSVDAKALRVACFPERKTKIIMPMGRGDPLLRLVQRISATPDKGSVRRAWRRARIALVAEDKPTLVEIVRSNFNGDAITNKRFDAILPHFTGGVSDEQVAIVEFDAVARIGQHFLHTSLESQDIFLGQYARPFLVACKVVRIANVLEEQKCSRE
jgi:hypothetical protein